MLLSGPFGVKDVSAPKEGDEAQEKPFRGGTRPSVMRWNAWRAGRDAEG